MARIRSIHPGIFTDEAFASLSMGARVLLFGIWTEADDHGVFEWKPVSLKMRVMPVDNVSIPDLLIECERADVIKRFSDGKSYGLVRNFCRYQRPKKPKYVHPMPEEFRTYAGLNKDGSLPVLHQSRTGGEKSPQREEEGGMMEDESGNGIEKKGESNPPSNLKLVEEGKAIPIDESYSPSDRAIEYAYSLGMKKLELEEELRKFITKSISLRVVSFNIDMNFKLWCDRWLAFKRKDNPNWVPTPEVIPATPRCWVDEGTLEWNCWQRVYNGGRGSPAADQKDAEGRPTGRRGWYFPTSMPEGFNDFGERIAPSEENAA